MAEQNSSGTLVQNRILKRSNRVTFQDNRTLRIDRQNNNKTTSYRIDVIALRPKHTRSFSFAWPWLIGAAVLFALLLIVINSSFVFSDPGAWQAILTEVVLGILSAVCLFLFIKLSYGKYIFKSRHAKVPLLDIWTGQPSSKAVKAFVKLLEQRIENAHNHMGLSKEQQITGEIKTLRRLTEENVLDSAEYEAARARLMKSFD
ncbi:MAG: hypothetical protein P8Y24_01295 [Gammaproteobacteria bacterium]